MVYHLIVFTLRILGLNAAKEKLVPVLSERSEVTKRNPAFQNLKYVAGKLSSAVVKTLARQVSAAYKEIDQ